MENKKTLETAGKELEKRVSAASNFNTTIEGTKSNLLDALILDENKQSREEFGNPIKEELKKRMKKAAKMKDPPKTKYIENMEKIMVDLDTRINKGEKTDDNRQNLLDLNEKEGFNTEVLKSFADEILEEAKTGNPAWKEGIITKLIKNADHRQDIERFLRHRILDEKDKDYEIQRKNIDAFIKLFKKEGPMITKSPENMEKQREKRYEQIGKIKSLFEQEIKEFEKNKEKMGDEKIIEILKSFISRGANLRRGLDVIIEEEISNSDKKIRGEFETMREGVKKIIEKMNEEFKDIYSKQSIQQGPQQSTDEEIPNTEDITKEPIPTKKDRAAGEKRGYKEIQKEPVQQIKQEPSKSVPKTQETQEKPTDEEEQKKLKELGKQLKKTKIGETISIKMPDDGIITLEKESDYGWKCKHTTSDEFRKYIENKENIKESRIRNEDLERFLKIPEEKKIPEIVETITETPPVTEEKIKEKIEESDKEGGEGSEEIEDIATISNVTEAHRAEAIRKAEEKLRARYKRTARYKPRSRLDKMNLFLRRQYIKERYTEKEMIKIKGIQRDESSRTAADRHEIEKQELLNKNIVFVTSDIDSANYPNTRKALDILMMRVTGTPPQRSNNNIKQAEFEKQFKAILEANLDPTKPSTSKLSNRKPLPDLFKENDMDIIGTNIFEKLNAFRDHQKLAYDIANYIKQNPNMTDAALSTYCRPMITTYISTYKTNPRFLKEYNIRIDDINAMKTLKTHEAALLAISAKTLKMKIQLLNKGEEAYNVKQEGGKAVKIGERLDRPYDENSKTGKRFKKHPFMREAFSVLRGTAKLAAVVTPAMLLAPIGPLAVAGWAGAATFTKVFFKKHAHYNKEHRGYQTRQAVNLSENTAERERLMNLVTNMNPFKRKLLYYFGLGGTARDVRQYRDYVETTQNQLSKTGKLNTDIKNLVESSKELTPLEQGILQDYLSDGLARLDYHRDTVDKGISGQNFLGSDTPAKAEEEYQSLHRLILAGASRLGIDLKKIRANGTYAVTLQEIKTGTGNKQNPNEIGYDEATKRKASRQKEKAIRGAIKAGGIAFGLSYIASSLAHSTNKDITTKPGKSIDVKEHFDLGKHELGSGNTLYADSKTLFNNTDSVGREISFTYGGGTDATRVIAGHLTQAEYHNKVVEVTKEIWNMQNMSIETKTRLLTELKNEPWKNVTGMTNNYLHNMRCLEGIENIAKGVNDSVNGSSITIIPQYKGSVYDIAGTTNYYNPERIVQGTLAYQPEEIVREISKNIGIGIPVPMNTFGEKLKRENADKKPKKEKTKKEEPKPTMTDEEATTKKRLERFENEFEELKRIQQKQKNENTK